MTDPRETLARIRALSATTSRTNVPRLMDALEAVLELHKCRTYPDDGIGEPTACTHCDNETWPCPTIRVMTTPLEGEHHA